MKSYKFDNVQDMVRLSKDIQTNVYWGGLFYLDTDEQIKWNEFWDVVDAEINNKNAKGVVIDDSNIVKFVY